MATANARQQHFAHPMVWLREAVMDMDNEEKLELMSLIIESMKPAATPPCHYTLEEMNAILDRAEEEIAAGIGTDDDDAWEELETMEREAEEHRMVGAI